MKLTAESIKIRFLKTVETELDDKIASDDRLSSIAIIVICGLMSCRGDAYKPAERLSEDGAFRFHSWQAEKLAEAGVDFLLAATLPALSEAIGLAAAQAATGKPYIISFVLRPQGNKKPILT